MEDGNFLHAGKFRRWSQHAPIIGFDNWMLVSYFYEEVGKNHSQGTTRDRTMNRAKLVECYLTRGFRCPSKVCNHYEKNMVCNLVPLTCSARHVFEQANALGTYKQYSSNSPYSNTYNPVGGIIQIYHRGEFLKDLCTVKRRIKLSKKAFLTEQVSAIIENKAMVKYKDPGCPTISVQIGDSFVERALLDLGASVNLLPYSIYKQLGLGELKATTITLSLADVRLKYLEE
ncbi:hypothetical protein CK203_043562 [Vitis vinifera]|uniref:Uncharacterized protein n=1 Tax=Vitis vinifera TaxID=29760 RepID=A0A438HYK4_VITVI|nr:hypothetical protein CK203_043562 [Vitis vinifera]